MSKLLKSNIKLPHGRPGEEITLEQVEYRLTYGHGDQAVVESRVINSYEELIQPAAQDCYWNERFIEVKLLPFLGGGSLTNSEVYSIKHHKVIYSNLAILTKKDG